VSRAVCSVEGCDRPAVGRGWCRSHYSRWQRHGDVQADVPLDLSHPKPWLVVHVERSLADYPTPTPQPTPCRLWQGALDKSGYGIRKDGTRMHVWVWEQINGKVPKGKQVCHHCDQPLCFRYDHLWLCTQLENIADRHAKGRSRGGHSKTKVR
jgi:hypothetical protein